VTIALRSPTAVATTVSVAADPVGVLTVSPRGDGDA